MCGITGFNWEDKKLIRKMTKIISSILEFLGSIIAMIWILGILAILFSPLLAISLILLKVFGVF